MIPTSVTALVLFLVFISPGFVFDWVADRRRPELQQRPLKEAGRAVVMSTGVTLPVWGLVAALAGAAGIVDVAVIIDDPAGQVGERTAVLGLLASAALGLSWAVAAGLALLLVKKPAAAVSPQPVLWQGIFASASRFEKCQALVKLRDGTVVLGLVQGVDIGSEEENPHLVIANPKVGRNNRQPADSGFHQVFLPMADVAEIWTKRIDGGGPARARDATSEHRISGLDPVRALWP